MNTPKMRVEITFRNPERKEVVETSRITVTEFPLGDKLRQIATFEGCEGAATPCVPLECLTSIEVIEPAIDKEMERQMEYIDYVSIARLEGFEPLEYDSWIEFHYPKSKEVKHGN